MTREEANEFIKSEEGAAWLNEQKAGLLSKRDELLGTVNKLTAQVTESGQRVHDAEALLTQEREAMRRLVVDGELDRLLTTHNVLAQHREAVKLLVQAHNDITVKADGQQRTAVIGDKSLADFMNEWAQTDAAKHYIAAPLSGGGDALGSGVHGSNYITRESLANMKPEEVAARLDDPAFRDSVAKLTTQR